MDFMNNQDLRRRVQARIKVAFPYNDSRAPSNKERLTFCVADVIQIWQAEMLIQDMDRKLELP